MPRSRYTFRLLLKLWPLGKIAYRLGNLPLVGRLFTLLFDLTGNEAIMIPVRQVIRGTESVVLPYSLMTPLIEQAAARFVMNECMCRRGEGCHTYPHDIGCLFLGPSAAQIDPALGRSTEVADALAHAKRAMEAGLLPVIIHAAFDAYVLGIPYRQMLVVCFCCDCCCAIHQGLRLGPAAFKDTVIRLPGLDVSVNNTCVGCGLCLSSCAAGAISLVEGRAQIDSAACKGCGRCAAVCPRGAIHLHLAEQVDVMARLLARVRQRTEIVARASDLPDGGQE